MARQPKTHSSPKLLRLHVRNDANAAQLTLWLRRRIRSRLQFDYEELLS